MKTALLLSGGMDSLAIAAWKKPDICFTINYGQKSAEGEIRASKDICAALGLQHEVLSVDFSSLGSGDLAGKTPDKIAPVSEWWPYRNQMLITVAAMRAVALGVSEMAVGSVKTDDSHKDGEKEFYRLADQLLSFQEGDLRITVPAIDFDTVELINISGVSIEVLSLSHSCHAGSLACGACRGCHKHRDVMEALGYDPY